MPARYWLAQTLWNLGIAGALAVLFWAQQGGSPARILENFLVAIIYASCIGYVTGPIVIFLLRRLRGRGRLWQWAALFVLLPLLAWVGAYWAHLILGEVAATEAQAFWEGLRGEGRFAVSVALSTGTAFLLYEGHRAELQLRMLELKRREMEKDRALSLAREAQFAALSARVHPHFLFNALNTVAWLIGEDPARAERTVERLGELLRVALDGQQAPLIPLEQELRTASNYLEIERARFGDRLAFEMDVPEDVRCCPVPPLSLQGLLENSVKHVAARRREPTCVCARARATEGALLLEVWDDGPGFGEEVLHLGRGLTNLKDRLAMLFGGAATLSISAEERAGRLVTVVRMTLPAAEGGA